MVQRYERQIYQRAANQLVQLLNADISGDVKDKTLLWEGMIKTYGEQTVNVFSEDLCTGIWLSNQDTHAHARGAGPLGRRTPRYYVVYESPQSIVENVTNTDKHGSLVVWQGQQRQGCCFVRQVWTHGRAMLARPCMLEVREERPSRRQVLAQDSLEPNCTACQGWARQTQVVQNCSETGHLAASCETARLQCRVTSGHLRPCPAMTMIRTVPTCSNMLLLAQASQTFQQHSFSIPHHEHRFIEDGLSSELSPQRADLSDEVEQTWRLLLEKIMGEGGQVVTLDVWIRCRGHWCWTCHGGRCSEAVGLELRNARWSPATAS